MIANMRNMNGNNVAKVESTLVCSGINGTIFLSLYKNHATNKKNGAMINA